MKNVVYLARNKRVAKKLYNLLSTSTFDIQEVSESNVEDVAKYLLTEEEPHFKVRSCYSVVEILKKLGFRDTLCGYKYLIEAIDIYKACDNPDEKSTMKAYVELSQRYGKSVSSIERAIRYSIKRAWKEGNRLFFKDILGDNYILLRKDAPSNRLIIHTVSIF